MISSHDGANFKDASLSRKVFREREKVPVMMKNDIAAHLFWFMKLNLNHFWREVLRRCVRDRLALVSVSVSQKDWIRKPPQINHSPLSEINFVGFKAATSQHRPPSHLPALICFTYIFLMRMKYDWILSVAGSFNIIHLGVSSRWRGIFFLWWWNHVHEGISAN